MSKYQIALIEGDGIGPEILAEGVKVLNAASDVADILIDYQRFPYGTEHYLKTKEVLPESAIEDFNNFNAIYFGALGDPRVEPGILETGLILKLRFAFDQYINLRPIKLYPNVPTPLKTKEAIDFYVVRENTEDFYSGVGAIFHQDGNTNLTKNFSYNNQKPLYNINLSIESKIEPADDYAINIGYLTKMNAERVIRYAFELARQKKKNKVTAVDKANVIPHMYGIWREAFQKVSIEFPDITAEYAFADAISMWFVKNPQDYGVVVAPNLFGDIISDLGAAVAGGLGFAAGANINPEGVSMFEPIHGSAPKYKGMNIANPIATILSGGLLMEHIGEPELGQLIDNAVTQVLIEKSVSTRDMGGDSTTSEMGDAIATKVYELAR